MGDFNVELLNYDSHTATNEFVNMMFSHHFQPSHIADTSPTTIDNININNATESSIFGGAYCILRKFSHNAKMRNFAKYKFRGGIL